MEENLLPNTNKQATKIIAEQRKLAILAEKPLKTLIFQELQAFAEAPQKNDYEKKLLNSSQPFGEQGKIFSAGIATAIDIVNVEHLKVKADQGDAGAQYALGDCYFQGEGVTKDYGKAVGYYQLSAAQEYRKAQFALGACYQAGSGVPQDEKKAAYYYQRAADQGYAEAQYVLGVYYKQGCNGIPKNERKAADYYQLSAAQEYREAQFALGACYQAGSGVPQDEEKAAYYYQRAADQGHAAAQFSLGICYQVGLGVPINVLEAINYCQEAANGGYADAQNYLGVCYERGMPLPLNQDIQEAIRWYQKAADQGFAAAQCNLGRCYQNGQGVSQDEQKAVFWYQKAADQGDAEAQYALGDCYFQGEGVTKDYGKAVGYYQLSADQGYVVAQYDLGICYKFGQGIDRNYAKAVHYLTLAANQGNDATAQYRLGDCYLQGEGVPKDKQEAIRWYQKAADQGNTEAEAKLKFYTTQEQQQQEKLTKPIKESSKKERSPEAKTPTVPEKPSKSWDTEIKKFLDELPNKDSSPIANVTPTLEGLAIDLNKRAQADYRTLVQRLKGEYQSYFVLCGGATSPNSVVLLTKKIKEEADVKVIKSIFQFEPEKKRNNPRESKPAEPELFYSPIITTEKPVKSIPKKVPPSSTFFVTAKPKPAGKSNKSTRHPKLGKKPASKPNTKQSAKPTLLTVNTTKIHPPEKGKVITPPPPRELPKAPKASLRELDLVKMHENTQEPEKIYTMTIPLPKLKPVILPDEQNLHFWYYKKVGLSGQAETQKQVILPAQRKVYLNKLINLSTKLQGEINALFNADLITKQAILYDFFLLLELTKATFQSVNNIGAILPGLQLKQLRESMKMVVFNHRKEGVNLHNLIVQAQTICERLQRLERAFPMEEPSEFAPLNLNPESLQTEEKAVAQAYSGAFFKAVESEPGLDGQFLDQFVYVEEFLEYMKMIEDDSKPPEEKVIALSAAKWCVIGLDQKQNLFEKNLGKSKDDLKGIFDLIHSFRNQLSHADTYRDSKEVRNLIMDEQILRELEPSMATLKNLMSEALPVNQVAPVFTITRLE